MSRRAAAATHAPGSPGGSKRLLSAPRSDLRPESASVGIPSDPEPAAGRRWCLWLPARHGPWRKSWHKVGGVRVPTKVRRLELPPGPNGSRGNPYAHAAWVKEWRQAALDAAFAQVWMHLDDPGAWQPPERVRISAVLFRRALGTADPDNDIARLKPILDGLRDARVLRKDTYGGVEIAPPREERAGADGPGVLLIVEELEHAVVEV